MTDLANPAQTSPALAPPRVAGVAAAGPRELAPSYSRTQRESPRHSFADEPTGNLDTENSNAVLGFLRDLNGRYGQTVLMITHNPEAAAYGHRILTMRGGRITEN